MHNPSGVGEFRRAGVSRAGAYKDSRMESTSEFHTLSIGTSQYNLDEFDAPFARLDITSAKIALICIGIATPANGTACSNASRYKRRSILC
jgi:hypothetical protein